MHVAGEKLWRMPLTRSLRGRLDSSVADLKNYAGAGTGS
jgi:leucyl aminopeptidase